MKWCMMVVCLAALSVSAFGAAVPEEEKTASDGDRLKRSGELFGYIGNKIGSKISAFASASGSLSSLSSASKHEYGPPTEQAKSFDFWTFKKALLNTLLQAVKAIKGGIIAIKGQLIKAKGHILTTKGRIISAKGEAISNFGKHIASTALNLEGQKHPPPPHPPPPHPSAPSAYSSGPSSTGFGGTFTGTAYGPPINSAYGAPSAPSGLYGAPYKLTARGSSGNAVKSTALPGGAQAGLLVIKPIPPSSGSARANSYTSNLHDYFGAPSQPVATFVSAPAPFAHPAALRRSDSSSYIHPETDYSILPDLTYSF